VGAQRLRILTGNLWHGQVGGLKVLQAARQQHADVIVLEEVRPKELAVMDNGGLGEEWPYRAGETDAALSGTMVFSRYPLGDVRRLPTHQGCWRMVVATPDGPWTMLAVHPESPVDVATWRADHRAILDASSGADLIVGDLNATPDQRPLQDLAAAGFRSAAELTNAGWQPTWPANGSFRLGGLLPLPPLVQIDHVLVGPRIAALRTAVVPLEDSDHRGLVVEVAAR
jgi:endonuclease/exonuclease/phosphatase (EEP) superfamily protein YafD